MSTFFTVKYDIYNNNKIDNLSITLAATRRAIKTIAILIMKENVKISMITKIKITITITEKKRTATKIMAGTELL